MPAKNNVGVFHVCFGMRYINKITNQSSLASVGYTVWKLYVFILQHLEFHVLSQSIME